jgi:hypothetical protein
MLIKENKNGPRVCRSATKQAGPAQHLKCSALTATGRPMIGRVLTILPRWVTGRLHARAVATVRAWTKKNPDLRRLRYGGARRLLLWGGEHPVLFPVAVGCLCAALAALVTSGHSLWPLLPALKPPNLLQNIDPGGYAGVPWTIQATLVALVYPIVVSFIALMLQRRAHSTVALRVYVLDSAVVPAGATSIGLLIAMGVQFFTLPYATADDLNQALPALLVFNGTWLAANVLLTGFFLGRTVRFVQDEENRHALTRLTVDVVLRSELVTAVAQHVLLNAPHADWGYSMASAFTDEGPQVDMFGWNEGATDVTLELQGPHVLRDVHLQLLRLAARSWTRRARNGKPAKLPSLSFPVRFGRVVDGPVKLCAIKNGPSLSWWERLLVRSAFVYRPYRLDALSLSTMGVLRELAAEVEALAEQKKYGASTTALDDFLRLHLTLLRASASEQQADVMNAATIHSNAYGLGDTSFASSWLEPYVDIARAAVEVFEKDRRLFRKLAYVPGRIAAALPPRPEKLAIDALRIGATLAYQLAAWGVRNGATSRAHSSTPMSQLYERGITDFVGGWGQFSVRIPGADQASDDIRWNATAARAKIYASHLDESVRLFVDAVASGDEIGATWFYEHFLKWWGNRSSELKEARGGHAFDANRANLSLADLSWHEVQDLLWQGTQPVGIELAEQAVSMALREYWEALRFYLTTLLVHYAGDAPPQDSLEIRYAAGLLQHREFKPGARVMASNLESFDSVMGAVLRGVFGDEAVRKRIDTLADKLSDRNRSAEVAMWVYVWAGAPLEMESMNSAVAKVLAAEIRGPRRQFASSKRFIEGRWKDVDTLASIDRYLIELASVVRSRDFRASLPAVEALRAAMGLPASSTLSRAYLVRALRALSRVAQHERATTLRARKVSDAAVRDLVGLISVAAFRADAQAASPIKHIEFVRDMHTTPVSRSIECGKEEVREGRTKSPSEEFVKGTGEDIIRPLAIAIAMVEYLSTSGTLPINEPALHEDHEASAAAAQSFVKSVAEECSKLLEAGQAPVVLVGRGAVSEYLQPYRWGPGDWQVPLPAGVAIRQADFAGGERAMAYLNDVPVYEIATPNDDCYVVPAADVETLQVQGASDSAALAWSWSPMGDDTIGVDLTWRAQLVHLG